MPLVEQRLKRTPPTQLRDKGNGGLTHTQELQDMGVPQPMHNDNLCGVGGWGFASGVHATVG